MATLPNNRGDRSEPVTMTATVKWNIPEGSKNARFRVIAVATNDAPINATSPTLLATIEFKVETLE
jgi:hypothetical protein